MKKINSIGYGPTILACGLVFALPVPMLFYLVKIFFGQDNYFMIIIKASFGAFDNKCFGGVSNASFHIIPPCIQLGNLQVNPSKI